MKIFVTGVNGQLGHDVMLELKKRSHVGIGSDIAPVCGWSTAQLYKQLDITEANAVAFVLRETEPDAVIHCAAWTAVDAAEDPDKKNLVQAVNGTGTKNIAQICKTLGCKMVYISTDYVFNGQGTAPWKPDCKTLWQD